MPNLEELYKEGKSGVSIIGEESQDDVQSEQSENWDIEDMSTVNSTKGTSGDYVSGEESEMDKLQFSKRDLQNIFL